MPAAQNVEQVTADFESVVWGAFRKVLPDKSFGSFHPLSNQRKGTVETPECQEQIPFTLADHLPISSPCPVQEEKAAEVLECKDDLPLIPPSQPPASNPCKIKQGKSVEILEQQTGENQEVNCTTLNPQACVDR